MTIKIGDSTTWICPQCEGLMNPTEVQAVVKMLKSGHSQVELLCDDCGEELTADTSESPEGELDLNEQWVYG